MPRTIEVGSGILFCRLAYASRALASWQVSGSMGWEKVSSLRGSATTVDDCYKTCAGQCDGEFFRSL